MITTHSHINNKESASTYVLDVLLAIQCVVFEYKLKNIIYHPDWIVWFIMCSKIADLM